MPTLFIDNQPYEVSSGKNLLEVCLTLGIDLPYFCWHPALGSVGACRQCAIKVYKDENDKQGKLIMSCMEPVTNNQRISVVDPEAKEFRDNVIGWLMTNHPHDCAVCDEGGACHLQDMTVMTGHAYRKFNFKKRTYKNQDLGPFINHEMNRCIQCYRCVRFYKDYAGGKDLDAFASKSNVYFGRHEDGPLENEFSGNLAEICPTGVFTDKTLKQHYTRKWDLTMAPSVCQHCSLGCNTIAGERYGGLRSITTRFNGEVNGYFLCDRGRFGYEFVNAPDRIRKPIINNQETSKEKTLEVVSRLMKETNVIGIGSPRASLQSNFALMHLVGVDNFYHGVSSQDHELASLVVSILKDGPARTPSMKEVETADAVFILGEDLTNTAPLLALAVRQSVRQQPMKQAVQTNIPLWNDFAVRELLQENRGPLLIAAVHATKLDEIATHIHYATPQDIARLGFTVAHLLDNTCPSPNNISPEEQTHAQQIANALTSANQPVIISGTSCGSPEIIQAAANIAWALNKKNKNAGIVLTLPECNSMGLALMKGKKLESAFDAIIKDKPNTVFILENDLYRHSKEERVNEFLNNCENVVVLDHTHHATAKKATHTIPAGTFAESDGVIVSNEGRAQRFFQVYESTDVIQESWRWLINIGKACGNKTLSQWKNFDDITNTIASEEILLKNIAEVAPHINNRINGQRVPREPHRYSGRTAMLADLNVSEPKPQEDPDSSMSYTMEGYRGMPPSTMIPFFWSPGWNSVQSINKYQQEVGKALRGGDPGIRLFEPSPNGNTKYFNTVPEKFIPSQNQLLVVPLHHIFGSEQLSSHAEAVAKRIPEPYVVLSKEDAATLKVESDQTLSFEIEGQSYQLPVRISKVLPKGTLGLPFGLSKLPFVALQSIAKIKNSQS